MTGTSVPAVASEAQLAYLSTLAAPDRLAALSRAEARFLIGWLRGAPANMSRGQQLYIADLVAALPSAAVRKLIEGLLRLAGQVRAPALAPAAHTSDQPETET